MMLTEINVFGVYISPYAPILFWAWGFTFVLRLLLSRLGILLLAWNPALLMFAIFVVTFSLAVLFAAAIA